MRRAPRPGRASRTGSTRDTEIDAEVSEDGSTRCPRAFIVLAILGPWLGADSRAPGGWTPTDPDDKLWPDRPETPDPPT